MSAEVESRAEASRLLREEGPVAGPDEGEGAGRGGALADLFAFARPRRFRFKLAYRTWQREVAVYRHVWKSTIAGNVADPVIYLLALGFGLGAYVGGIAYGGQQLSYLEFIAPGLIASSVMMAATFEVAWNSWMRMHTERVYHAMLTTPANIEDIVQGELWWATTRATIYGTVMLAILAVLGLVQSPWALLVLPMVALGGYLFAAIGLAYTGAIPSMDHLTFYFTLFITPQFLFSGIFFPLDRLPVAVQQVALLTPLYHLVRIVRGLVLGNLVWDFALSLAWLVGVTLLLYALPINVVERRLVR